MTVDPRALKSFLVVCREGSISGAARRLNVTQPAVSATINQLEYALGCSLFSRARSGITLTAEGKALRRRAEALDALLVQAEREVALAKKQVRGPLMVGGTPGALASLLPNAVAQMRLKHSAFELQLLERSDDQLSELLRTGHIDIAIVTTGMVQLSGDLVEEPILTDPFSLIVGRANYHLPKRIALKSLSGAAWVLPDAAGAFRRQVDALFVSTDASAPANVIRSDSLLTTKAIVRETDYMTILPREVASAELGVGVLRAIEIDGAFMRSVGVRMLADAEPAPLASEFLEALRTPVPKHKAKAPISTPARASSKAKSGKAKC